MTGVDQARMASIPVAPSMAATAVEIHIGSLPDGMAANHPEGGLSVTVVKSNDKKRARINCMKHFLASLDYPGKDAALVGQPDPLIVGQAALFQRAGV